MQNNEINEFIENVLEDLKKNNYIYSSKIPNIDLYMDQVTTFMDDHLDLFKRNDEDKILTKTMINNYSKSGLMPPTNKKKYSRNHMLLLLMIYYLKPVLSIPDIQALIEPLQKMLMNNKDSDLDLETYYDSLVKTQLSSFDGFSKELMETVNSSNQLFNQLQPTNNDHLSIVTTIYMLSLQASMQKHIVTLLIDNYLLPKAGKSNPSSEERKELKVEKRAEKLDNFEKLDNAENTIRAQKPEKSGKIDKKEKKIE